MIRGVNISEHLNRFGKGKPYSLEDMQHLVIDFRDNVPNRAYPENYVADVLDAAFKTAEVLFWDGKKVTLKLNK